MDEQESKRRLDEAIDWFFQNLESRPWNERLSWALLDFDWPDFCRWFDPYGPRS